MLKKELKFELIFFRTNKRGVIEAEAYDVDIGLNSRFDLKYVNKFITGHLKFYETGEIRKVVI